MIDFTRLTIVGSIKRATIVVPSHESLGSLIPHLMGLLGEPVASVARPLTLVRLTGEQLDTTLSSAGQTVGDGEILRLLRLDEAPPPPEVSDVTDAVSESLGSRAGLWSSLHRTTLGSGAVGALVLVASLQAIAAPGLQALPLMLWGVASLAGFGLALSGRRAEARMLLGAALGSTVSVGILAAVWVLLVIFGDDVVTKAQSAEWTWAIAVTATLLAVWIALFLVAGLGCRSRPAAFGSSVGVVGSALALVLATGFAAAGLSVAEAAAIVAVVAVVGVGLIPWCALSASGLTGLDDQVMTGMLADRDAALSTVADAYRTLTWTTFAAGGILAVALFGTTLSRDPWVLGLGAVVVLITALRTRAFPLAAQAWPLWIAALLPVLRGAVTRLFDPAEAAAFLVLVAVGVAVLVIVQPASHRRASFRRAGDILESVAVVALIPLLLGSFDVYDQLLGSPS